MAAQAANTLLGNNTASSAAPAALTISQVAAHLGLGTAASQPSSAFDASGAAATAQANAIAASAPSACANGSYACTASPALSGTPTAPTQAISTNNNDIATTAAVATALAGTVSSQATGVLPLGTSATSIGAQSHLDDGNTITGQITSTEPFNVKNVGTFGASTYTSYMNSIISGGAGAAGNCALNGGAWYQSITAAVSGCVTAPAAGTGPRNVAGGIFAAYTQDNSGSYYSEPVGVIGVGTALANGGAVFGANLIAQDKVGCCTSGVVLVGQENDVEPASSSGPSAYTDLEAYRATLAFTNGNTGTYPARAFTINSNQAGAYWQTGLTTYTGAFGPSSVLFNINALGVSTSSSGNYNCPTLLNSYESYWTGTANAYEGWTMNCSPGSGTNPALDSFQIGHGIGTSPSGQVHNFDLTGGIQLELDGSTNGSAYLSASATGGTLNLGSTNATVTSAGALTVTSCSGCGGTAPVTSVFTRTGAVTAASGDYTVSQVTGAAPLASPALTGTPTTPTATSGTNTTQIASTAFVQSAVAAATTGVASFNTRTGAVTPASGDYTVSQVTGAAPSASPTLTGTPTAPTQAITTNNTDIATTAAVTTALSGYATSGANSSITSLSGLTTPLTVAQGGIGASTSAANTVFGNFTGSSATPGFSATPVFSAATLTNFPTFNQNTTGSAGSVPWTGVTGGGANTVTTATSSAAPWTLSAAGAASTSGLTISGAPYTGGSGTTTTPQLYVNSGTAPSTWSTAGTMFGINAPSGFTGNPIDFRINGGSSLFNIDQFGDATGSSAFFNKFSSSYSPSASTSALSFTGNVFTGGTGTTTFPLFYINKGGATAVTTFSTAGTELGINAPTGFTGNFMDFYVNGGSAGFSVNSNGTLQVVGVNSNASISAAGNLNASGSSSYNITTTNTTAATSSTCSSSGALLTSGRYWNGTASAVDTISLTPSCTSGTNGAEILTAANTVGSTGQFTFAVAGQQKAGTYATTTNCSSGASPAVCSAAPAGAIAIPTGSNPTLTVNTTAVTATSQIFLQSDDSLTISGVTCNSTLASLVGGTAITGRTAGASFTITFNGTLATNPLCLSYHIIN